MRMISSRAGSDSAVKSVVTPTGQMHRRRAILIVALAPVVPQLLGSIFNIFYNATVIEPLLRTPEMKQRFIHTVIAFNLLIYPLAVAWWLRVVFQLRAPFRRLCAGETVEAESLAVARQRLIHLPWRIALVSGVAWLLCIPVFLIALGTTGAGLDAQLLWHLPTSFLVAAFIAVTHSFFLVELASHWGLYPVFFRDARADRMTGVFAVSLRTRGIMWAISAGICPICSLLLLSFAPASPGMTPWFAAFVGTVGIVFGLATAILISRLVSEPIEHLRFAAQAVAEGRLDVEVSLRRADEFGLLIGEFNHMILELREKGTPAPDLRPARRAAGGGANPLARSGAQRHGGSDHGDVCRYPRLHRTQRWASAARGGRGTQ